MRRSAWQRGKRPKDGKPFKKAVGKAKRKTGLAAKSKKLQRKLVKDYYPAQKLFLKQPENCFCWICIGRTTGATRSEIRAIFENPDWRTQLQLSGARLTPSSEAHHYRGRCGRLLDFEPFFVASCKGCREWPHAHAREARALDLLAPASLYNVFPSSSELERLGIFPVDNPNPSRHDEPQ